MFGTVEFSDTVLHFITMQPSQCKLVKVMVNSYTEHHSASVSHHDHSPHLKKPQPAMHLLMSGLARADVGPMEKSRTSGHLQCMSLLSLIAKGCL